MVKGRARQDHDEGPTVVVRLGGGLGNQLFQYAFGRQVSEVNGARLILDASGYRSVKEPDPRLGVRALGLGHFNIRGELITEGFPGWYDPSLLPARPWLKRKYMKWTRKLQALWDSRNPYYLRRTVIEPVRQHFTFDERVLRRRVKGTVEYQGYWQSEKYFVAIEPKIRSELTVVAPMNARNAQLASEIQACESISVHVRHGDNASGTETGLGSLPHSYYQAAIEGLAEVTRDPRFFVFSDDIDWARSMLKLGPRAVFVDHNEDRTNFEDLRLMSMCAHHILANSTFSWWGAWLAKHKGQVVYAPRRYWQNVDRANPDLYPAGWRLL